MLASIRTKQIILFFRVRTTFHEPDTLNWLRFFNEAVLVVWTRGCRSILKRKRHPYYQWGTYRERSILKCNKREISGGPNFIKKLFVENKSPNCLLHYNNFVITKNSFKNVTNLFNTLKAIFRFFSKVLARFRHF